MNMNRRIGKRGWRAAWLVAVLALCLTGSRVMALIRVGTGAPPVQPGWPEGAAACAALPSVVQWYEGPPYGGGNWVLLNRGGTAALQEAVDLFGRIRARVKEIELRSGPLTNALADPKGPVQTVDWELSVWVRGNWDHLFGSGASPKLRELMKPHPDSGHDEPPVRLTVHVHPAGPDWTAIRVPEGIRVKDLRSGAGKEAAEDGPGSGPGSAPVKP